MVDCLIKDFHKNYFYVLSLVTRVGIVFIYKNILLYVCNNVYISTITFYQTYQILLTYPYRTNVHCTYLECSVTCYVRAFTARHLKGHLNSCASNYSQKRIQKRCANVALN